MHPRSRREKGSGDHSIGGSACRLRGYEKLKVTGYRDGLPRLDALGKGAGTREVQMTAPT